MARAPVLCHELGEVRALDEAHGEEEDAVVLAGLVDRDDVWVIERRCDPRLPQEAFAKPLVLGELRSDHFERNLAPEPLLVGTVDRAHPPTPDEGLDPVAGDRRSGRQLGARDVAHQASVRHGRAECNSARRAAVV